MRNITVKESILIAASPERIWDFTQDYARRPEWDDFVRVARVEQASPRVVWIQSSGMTCRFRYKLEERPRKTSLAITDITPGWLFAGGGGSWTYEVEGGGTRFTNTGSLTIKNPLLYWLLRPIVGWLLRASYRKAMRKAKRLIEMESELSGHGAPAQLGR